MTFLELFRSHAADFMAAPDAALFVEVGDHAPALAEAARAGGRPLAELCARLGGAALALGMRDLRRFGDAPPEGAELFALLTHRRGRWESVTSHFQQARDFFSMGQMAEQLALGQAGGDAP